MDLEKFYNKYHRKKRGYKKILSLNNFTYFILLKLLNRPPFIQHKTFLDIGCGVGSISLYLASKGKKVLGVDVSSKALKIADQAKKENRLLDLEFEKISAEEFNTSKRFDAVLLIEVIEHIKDDKRLLKKIYSFLKKDGHLLLTTPSSENIMYKLGFYKEFDRKVGHIRRYAKKQLIKMLEDSGFEIIQYYKKESILRSLLFTTKMGLLIRFIRGPLVAFFHRLDDAVGKIFGFTDHIIIAQKRSN